MRRCMIFLLVAVLALFPPLTVAGDTLPPVVSGDVQGINEAGLHAALLEVANADGITNGFEAHRELAWEQNIPILRDIYVSPGDEIRINLTAGMFAVQDPPSDMASMSGVALGALTTGRIGISHTLQSGGNMASSISLGGNAYQSWISIRFIDSIFAENAIHHNRRFSYTISLTSASPSRTVSLIRITGTMQGEVVEIDSGRDLQVDASNGLGVRATGTVQSVEFYLGNGVTITRSLARGRYYFGRAITDLRSVDHDVLDRYEGVSHVIRLETVGLRASGNAVRFDLPDVYYVYNSFGLFLGRSNARLPWWSTYYLSTTRYQYLSGLT